MTLITKYRPTKFADVLGQGSAVKSLERAIRQGSSRTILITGAPGLGKTTLARLTAAAVGCHAGDLIEIDAATHTGIDDMRAIAETMGYQPLMGDARVVIVDEAQAISKAGVQSLLKTFEEPPRWGWWIMCTTEPTKIPAALRSRCLHLALQPVEEVELAELLIKIAGKEKITFKFKGAIDACVKEAYGSPRQAIANLAACAGATTLAEVLASLQSAFGTPQAIDLARLLANGCDWKTCQTMLRSMKDQNGESVRQVVRAYSTTMALSIGGGPKLRQALAVLEAFNTPINTQDGISPIILACATLLLSD